MKKFSTSCLSWINTLLIFVLLSGIKLHANQYTVGVAVNDTISESLTYSTPCTDGSLEFVLEETLIPYVTGLTFQVEILETSGIVLSNVIDTIRAGDKIPLPTPGETGTLQVTIPASDDAFTFITTVTGTPQIVDETYHCSLCWAITEAVCHNAFYIYVEDTLQCTVQLASGLDHDPIRPVDFELCQNFPNPFNPSTTFRYTLPVSGLVNLRIYNLAGQEIETLVHSRQSPGTHEITWTAEHMPGGIYFFQINVGNHFGKTRKMILLK
jgi:hypothetical protein